MAAPDPTASPLAALPPAVAARARRRSLAAGEALFRQGDRAVAIFWVEAGRLRLLRHTVDDHMAVLHTARAGELFAEAALFAATYHCDAVAAAPSVVRVYPKREVLAAFRADAASAERFMAALARQIHALRARLEARNIRQAKGRVLHHLALAADPATRRVVLDGTLIDLAAELGLSHEALYRTLAALEREGRIARSRDAIALVVPG
jgi:CRP-like cAMP-binding protein